MEQATTRPARRAKRERPDTSVIHATVTNVELFRPKVRRITLQSDQFAGWIASVPDQFITFMFPKGDRKTPAVGVDFDWDNWFTLPDGVRPHARNYTVRFWRPERNEVDVDMILHGDDGEGSVWAMAAEPGDMLAIWGPRVAYDPPPNATWQLLVGDETALPAMAAILEHLPATCRVQVIAEVEGPDSEYPLEFDGSLDVTWLHRGDRHPGFSDALIAAVRGVEIPDEVRYAWGGGEIRTMQEIGRYLRRECGFRPSDVTAIGYW